MNQMKEKTSMSVPEMRRLLGLGKTESYYLVKKQYFKTITVGGKMRVMIDSFEKWYGNQSWYKKVDGMPPGERIKQTTLSAEELGQLLGISEASAYVLIAKGYFDEVPVLGKKRISKDSFEKWYLSQSQYRTVEDQEKDKVLARNTYTMPELAKMLGIHRNSFYYIAYRVPFETIQIGRQKRITKDSFLKWYQGQQRYILHEDAEILKERDAAWLQS